MNTNVVFAYHMTLLYIAPALLISPNSITTFTSIRIRLPTSKYLCVMSLKTFFLRQFTGSIGMSRIWVFTMYFIIVAHYFCWSVRQLAKAVLALSSLNLSIMTLRKRPIAKKVVKKRNEMNRSWIYGLKLIEDTSSSFLAESTAANIISGHISSVEISKKVLKAKPTLS